MVRSRSGGVRWAAGWVGPVRAERAPGRAVAGGRRGVGLQPATDGEDGALQFGGDALGDVVVGPRQVVEALGAGQQVAAPPLVEPDLGAADGGADGLDGPAGE